MFALAAAGTAQAAVVLGADYEDGTLTSGVPGLAAVKPPAGDAFSVSSRYARVGTHSLCTKIADSADYYSDGNHRAETNALKVAGARFGQGYRFRYRFSVLIPPEWEDDSRDSIDIIFQFKRTSG